MVTEQTEPAGKRPSRTRSTGGAVVTGHRAALSETRAITRVARAVKAGVGRTDTSPVTWTTSDFHRFFVPGGSYFFTVITQDRRPILVGLASLDRTLPDSVSRPLVSRAIVVLSGAFWPGPQVTVNVRFLLPGSKEN
jgi:hypothetical protein